MAYLPAYKRIKLDLLDKIRNGELKPGDKVPTEAELMASYDVSRITVQKALTELKDQAVLERFPRTGSFVKGLPATAEFSERTRLSISVVAPFELLQNSTYQYMNGIMRSLDGERDNLSLHNTNYSRVIERRALENTLRDGCDGILYYPGKGDMPPMDLIAQIVAAHVPCVLMDKSLPVVNLPCVQTDNYSAGRTVTQYLIKKGHKRVEFLLDEYSSSIYERYMGYFSVMQENGLAMPGSHCTSAATLAEEGITLPDVVRKWVDSGVTAVVCCADNWCVEVRKAAQKLRISVPGKLAIAGFDGAYPGDITSMAQPYSEIGAKAASILLDMITGGNAPTQQICLPARLIPGVTA